LARIASSSIIVETAKYAANAERSTPDSGTACKMQTEQCRGSKIAIAFKAPAYNHRFRPDHGVEDTQIVDE
jgi:hypothetical protein